MVAQGRRIRDRAERGQLGTRRFHEHRYSGPRLLSHAGVVADQGRATAWIGHEQLRALANLVEQGACRALEPRPIARVKQRHAAATANEPHGSAGDEGRHPHDVRGDLGQRPRVRAPDEQRLA